MVLRALVVAGVVSAAGAFGPLASEAKAQYYGYARPGFTLSLGNGFGYNSGYAGVYPGYAPVAPLLAPAYGPAFGYGVYRPLAVPYYRPVVPYYGPVRYGYGGRGFYGGRGYGRRW